MPFFYYLEVLDTLKISVFQFFFHTKAVAFHTFGYLCSICNRAQTLSILGKSASKTNFMENFEVGNFVNVVGMITVFVILLIVIYPWNPIEF